MTYTAIIAKAMQIGRLLTLPVATPPETRCSYTRQEITEGYAYEGGFISEPTARVLLGQLPNSKGKMVSAMWNRGSIFCFESGAHYWPMQNPDSALREGRVAWRDVLRLIWDRHRGERCVIVATTDVKKAVWDMYADGGAGTLGRATPVVIHVPGVTTGLRVVDWQGVLAAQEVAQRCRAAGYQRVDNRLLWPLWSGWLSLDSSVQASRAVIVELEASLREYHNSPELLIALIAEGYRLSTKQPNSDDDE